MPNASNSSAGAKISIDPTLLDQIEASRPAYLSRTGYVNHLVQRGLAERAREIKEAIIIASDG